MLTYLTNRHYHALTQLLPPQLRVDQPQRIYYRTFKDEKTLKALQQNKKITHKTLGVSNKKLINRKRTLNINVQKLNACPLCYETHISVQYHGHNHICVLCRNFVRDQFGNQIKIFLDSDGNIVCLGILPKSLERDKLGYYVTDHTKLQVANTGVYATYAGENQLVLILKENKKN